MAEHGLSIRLMFDSNAMSDSGGNGAKYVWDITSSKGTHAGVHKSIPSN